MFVAEGKAQAQDVKRTVVFEGSERSEKVYCKGEKVKSLARLHGGRNGLSLEHT